MASRPDQKTAVFDSVVYAMFNGGIPVGLCGGYPHVFTAGSFRSCDIYGTLLKLWQNYGNTFGNFINATASNILNFEIEKKLKNPLYKQAGTRRINQQVPAVSLSGYP